MMASNLNTAIQEAQALLAMLKSIEQLPSIQMTTGFNLTVADISNKLQTYNNWLRNLRR